MNVYFHVQSIIYDLPGYGEEGAVPAPIENCSHARFGSAYRYDYRESLLTRIVMIIDDNE